MSYMPRLPESAPFSPSERAWLDGFLAGWFAGLGDDGAPPPPPNMPAAEPPEDFPWHDPALPLEERLLLAQGRPRERILMAAMAQLDCGQCGYLCRTYAEAVATGAESNLGRCVPGGKATSRKLKELLAGGAAEPRPAPLAGATPPQQAPERHFAARFLAARPLNRARSPKDTRHVVLAASVEELAYEAGDSLGIRAKNDPQLVAAIIERLGAACDAPVPSPDGVERPLAAALAEACEIRRVSDRAIEVLASRAHDRGESRVLQAVAEGYPGAGPADADLLDLLEAFPSARPPAGELISALDPLLPRLYSIASSPKAVRGEVHLTVAAVRYEKRARRRGGVASTYLSDRAVRDEAIGAFIHPAPQFRLPADPAASIVMIGPGTGIAPFRAFLQERRAIGAGGRNWLFFGNPHGASDFLFEEEILAWRRDGLLTRLDTAFSRDQEEKLYVQHRLLENARELWAWLEDGAYLYLCGDAQRMARDVEAGLLYIVASESGGDAAAAKSYLARLAQQGRYLKDVY